MPDIPNARPPERERLATFKLYEYEIPLLLQIRQARKLAVTVTRRFLIEVEADNIYLIEIPKDKRVALA